jgi:hypothetical protein
MNFTRAFLLVGAVLAALTGALCLFPGAAARLGLDFWTVPELGLDMQRGEADAADMDRQSEETVRRLTAKGEAVQEVLDGRLTLWQAAARFRDLDATARASARRQARRRFPGLSEDERSCRQVIAWAAEADEKRPGGGTGLARRLTAELEDALRHGRLSLPDPAPTACPDQEGTPQNGVDCVGW